jgi:hypothetical protein
MKHSQQRPRAPNTIFNEQEGKVKINREIFNQISRSNYNN